MALRSALMRMSSSSNLVSNFFNSSKSITPLLLNSSRLLSYSSSVPVVDSNDENCTINAFGGSFTRSDQFPIQRGISDQYMENPFQISGPRGAYEAKKVAEGLYFRMEMPGIDKDDVKVWVEYKNVYIKGEGKKESKHEDSGRTYSAHIEIDSHSFQPEFTEAEMKNGVLRMVVPKSKTYQGVASSNEIKVK